MKSGSRPEQTTPPLHLEGMYVSVQRHKTRGKNSFVQVIRACVGAYVCSVGHSIFLARLSGLLHRSFRTRV